MNYENDTFSVKTLGNIVKAMAFTLREEIDRYEKKSEKPIEEISLY